MGLIGAGSLLTAAFVKDARSFVRRNSRPLLASPARIVQTLNFYPSAALASVGEVARPDWFGCTDDQGFLLTMGRWELEPPPAPTWREFLVGEGFAVALQLPFCFEVRAPSDRLVSSAPGWPCDGVGRLDPLSGQPDGDAPNFLD